MESAKQYSQKLFFLIGERLGLIIILLITAILLLTQTAIKAYSESETQSYRQESIFDDAGLTVANGAVLPDINPQPATDAVEEKAPVIEMSFEVDKITPTPTPIFDPADDAVWLKVAECESHQNWKDDTGNGYYGGLQFSQGAWTSVGGSGKPSDASSSEQIMRGKMLQKVRGWGAWGACSSRLGLR
jgi:hypothetical protein